MPRLFRLDAEGILPHVIIRGIERRIMGFWGRPTYLQIQRSIHVKSYDIGIIVSGDSDLAETIETSLLS